MLEDINGKLIEKRDKSSYQQIKDILGNAEYHETETHIYHLDTGIIFPLRKKNYATKEEALASLQETRIAMWKDPIQIQKVMEKQPSIHY